MSFFEDFLEFLLYMISDRRAWAFVAGAVGAAITWVAVSDNLPSGQPMLIGGLASAAALCGFASLFMPDKLIVVYIVLMATAVVAIAAAALLIAV